MSPAAAGAVSVVDSVGGGLSALAIVTVSWLSPESTTISWPARNPNGVCEPQAGRPHGLSAVQRRPQRVVRVLVDHGRQIGERRRHHERVCVLGGAARDVLERHCLRVLADCEPVERQRPRDHELAVQRHPPRGRATGAVGDGVARVPQARIGPQRGQRLRLHDLAVHDRRHVHRGADEVRLRPAHSSTRRSPPAPGARGPPRSRSSRSRRWGPDRSGACRRRRGPSGSRAGPAYHRARQPERPPSPTSPAASSPACPTSPPARSCRSSARSC